MTTGTMTVGAHQGSSVGTAAGVELVARGIVTVCTMREIWMTIPVAGDIVVKMDLAASAGNVGIATARNDTTKILFMKLQIVIFIL